MTLKPDTIKHSIQITHSSIESFGFELKTWNLDADNFSLSFSKKNIFTKEDKSFSIDTLLLQSLELYKRFVEYGDHFQLTNFNCINLIINKQSIHDFIIEIDWLSTPNTHQKFLEAYCYNESGQLLGKGTALLNK
ncbi:hypothetical protein [Flectobacillus longus]|uniref:hypothetical protein n=1 Tax=Flectobacillus longus TaxID=2984207 RepID=UPI0024B7C5FB|nr:hypothetical protein [Flectobacillus longus]MDI9878130.1 hypothetical protein [Flectobacillus longus]